MAAVPKGGTLSLIPARDVTQTLYVLDMPQTLLDYLSLSLSPEGDGEAWLDVDSLARDLERRLDRVASVRSPLPGDSGRDWIVATRPIDTRRLASIVGEWMGRTQLLDESRRSDLRGLVHALEESLATSHARQLDVRLLDDQARPIGNWSRKAFCHLLADAVQGSAIPLADGRTCSFVLVDDGLDRGCSLMSRVAWDVSCPRAAYVRLSLENRTGQGGVRVRLEAGGVLLEGLGPGDVGSEGPDAQGLNVADLSAILEGVTCAMRGLAEPEAPVG